MVLEQRAQDACQPHDHLPRHLRAEAHQRGDRIERVEEEVGIDLTLQGVKMRLEQQPFLLFQLDLDAAHIPYLQRDRHHHDRACPDGNPRCPAGRVQREEPAGRDPCQPHSDHLHAHDEDEQQNLASPPVRVGRRQANEKSAIK